jgi:hypothetical protein
LEDTTLSHMALCQADMLRDSRCAIVEEGVR